MWYKMGSATAQLEAGNSQEGYSRSVRHMPRVPRPLVPPMWSCRPCDFTGPDVHMRVAVVCAAALITLTGPEASAARPSSRWTAEQQQQQSWQQENIRVRSAAAVAAPRLGGMICPPAHELGGVFLAGSIMGFSKTCPSFETCCDEAQRLGATSYTYNYNASHTPRDPACRLFGMLEPAEKWNWNCTSCISFAANVSSAQHGRWQQQHTASGATGIGDTTRAAAAPQATGPARPTVQKKKKKKTAAASAAQLQDTGGTCEARDGDCPRCPLFHGGSPVAEVHLSSSLDLSSSAVYAESVIRNHSLADGKDIIRFDSPTTGPRLLAMGGSRRRIEKTRLKRYEHTHIFVFACLWIRANSCFKKKDHLPPPYLISQDGAAHVALLLLLPHDIGAREDAHRAAGDAVVSARFLNATGHAFKTRFEPCKTQRTYL